MHWSNRHVADTLKLITTVVIFLNITETPAATETIADYSCQEGTSLFWAFLQKC